MIIIDNAYERKITEIGGFIISEPWEISPGGVTREVVNRGKKDSTYTEIASPIPVLPSAILENVDSKTEKLELTYFKHNRWTSFITERSVTANRNTIIRLADKGLEVNSDNAASLVRFIADTVANSLETLPHKPAKSVLGWVDGEFMPYTDKIVFDGDDNFKHLFKAVTSKGKLQDWIDYIKPLRNNIDLRLAMATSFASPLIEIIGENPFVFHLFGGTGSGKTVALMVAMSVWGDPSAGKLTRTMNMTSNSMLTTAAFLRNLPFAGDELQTIKSRWTNYDNLIMCITEGIDRGRMSYNEVKETKSWKCSFLFTGEEPCIKQASGGGAKNRVIEIECKDKIIPNGNATANFVRTHFGCAGKQFIESIDTEQTISTYNIFFNEILKITDTTDKQAGAMALMLTADKMASELFFEGEKPLTVNDVKQYLCSANEVDIAERAYAFTINMIAKNAEKFEAGHHETWGRIDEEENTALINKLVLEEQLESKGFDFDAVKSKWRERGYIDPTGKHISHWTTCYGSKANYIKLILEPPTQNSMVDTTQNDDLPIDSDDLPF